MNFEKFMNTLVLAWVEHDFMRTEILSAGIDIDELPSSLIAVEIWREFKAKAETQSWALTVEDMQPALTVLAKDAYPLTALPKTSALLSERFNQMWAQFEFKRLGSDLSLAPQKGRELLERFKLSDALAVDDDALGTLEDEGIPKNRELAALGRSIVKIKAYPKLSEMIGGFNPERIGMLLGATGFGKTNAAVNLCLAAAETMRVGYVNMEMGRADILKRFYVIATKTPYRDYARGETPSRMTESQRAIRVTSGRALSFEQIAAKTREWKAKFGLDFVVVDYDQKIQLKNPGRTEEWKALQNTIVQFEEIAKELSLYCLVLAQVNRDGEVSGSFRSQFPAHTVLQFHEHETFGPVIEAKKNRHGERAQALTVLYDLNYSAITELEVVTLSAKKDKPRHELKSAPKRFPPSPGVGR